ncbi:transcriptional regulator [Haloplanus salinus]|uniref:Transcriptional regulator n=2 Tax=Haloplanus salinus TaxID=1126245 RepID=A0A368N2D5_9EURY|nr:transcriptional regulator [Haloplanus salinus]
MSTHPEPSDTKSASVVTPGQSQETLISMADVLGRKWHLVILHELLTEGAMGFGELKGEIDHISSKVLSDSLDRLETEHDLVERRIVSEKPVRVEYAMTDRGRDLAPIVTRIHEWGVEHVVRE